MSHNFLWLALLFLPPGALVWLLRADLRRSIHRMALVSLPFALTERFFVPTYWEPVFLFDLQRTLGFGVEDVLFVVGLSAFTVSGYPFVFRRRWTDAASPRAPRRLLGLGALTAAGVGLAVFAGVPMIYAAPALMLGVSAAMWVRRPHLASPSLLSGIITLVIYSGLCMLYQTLLPRVFELTWHTDRFLDLYVAGIPVEELLYGFAAGVAAPSFYGVVWGSGFERVG